MTTREAPSSARERWGWALVFGVPVGAGVGLATARMARAGLADPLVLPAALTAAVLVVVLVGGAATVGGGDG